jgi:hypothetical protein
MIRRNAKFKKFYNFYYNSFIVFKYGSPVCCSSDKRRIGRKKIPIQKAAGKLPKSFIA